MKEEDKHTQDSVQYVEVNNAVDECDTCKHFICPNACEHVQSPIEPTGWCVKYQAKK